MRDTILLHFYGQSVVGVIRWEAMGGQVSRCVQQVGDSGGNNRPARPRYNRNVALFLANNISMLDTHAQKTISHIFFWQHLLRLFSPYCGVRCLLTRPDLVIRDAFLDARGISGFMAFQAERRYVIMHVCLSHPGENISPSSSAAVEPL